MTPELETRTFRTWAKLNDDGSVAAIVEYAAHVETPDDGGPIVEVPDAAAQPDAAAVQGALTPKDPPPQPVERVSVAIDVTHAEFDDAADTFGDLLDAKLASAKTLIVKTITKAKWA